MQLRDLTKTAEDAAHVAIGAGVLTYRRIAEQILSVRDGAELRSTVRARLDSAQRRLEQRLEPVVGVIEERLPARTVVARGRRLAGEAAARVRSAA